jgi:DNA-binding beta-propeller fold protein YncE
LFSALGSGVAWADTGLGFSSEFGGAGEGAGQFRSPTGVAVDQSSGDVYVVDSANARVEKFGPAGEFLLTFGKEVDETTGADICTAASLDICKAGTRGEEPGQFGVQEFFGVRGPAGIAVDPTAPHHVYVTDSVNSRVEEFDSTGDYLGQVSGSDPSCGGSFSNPTGIAVDPSSGELYVADTGNSRVVKINPVTGLCNEVFDNEIAASAGFASVGGIVLDAAGDIYVVAGEKVDKFNVAGELQATEALDTGGAPVSVTVNTGTNDVYVGDSSGSGYHFLQYGPTGTLLAEFGDTFYPSGFMPFVESSTGVGVSQGSGDVYASDRDRDDVVIFSPTTALPSISGVSAPSPGARTATLKGTIAPGDATNSYHFEYGLNTTYANGSTTEATPNTGAAEAELTGLEPNMTYHYRLVASNAKGTTYGADQTVQTAEAVPSIDGESHEGVTRTDAVLRALINPNNLETSYQFKIGTNTSYSLGTMPSPAGTLSSGFGDQEVSLDLNVAGITLAPNTEYHYKVIATNASGPTVEGEDQTFTTLPLPPTAVTEGASNITQTTATILGDVNGQGADTHYYFNFVSAEDYRPTESNPYSAGGQVPSSAFEAADAGIVSSDTTVLAQLTGLSPNTTYHYQIAAFNLCSPVFSLCIAAPSQTAMGQDATFTTLALSPVAVADPSGGNISPNSATVTGSADLQGVSGSYHFEYGPSTAYGSSTPVGTLGASELGQAVNANLAGLAPNTAYHYRLVVTNNGGTNYSEDETFTTYTTAPAVATGQANGVGSTAATLGGSLDPQGADTTYWFQYSTTTSYNTSAPVPGADAGSGNGFQSVTQSISGLAPDTTYHYRLVTNNAGGTTYGADQTFTTASAVAPVSTTTTTTSTTKPKVTPPPKETTTPKTLTRAQKLIKALKSCKKDKSKAMRASCEKQAKKQYRPVVKKKGPKPKKRA